MRLFVAVDVGPPVADVARSTVAELRERARRLAPRARVTWVTADRIHLTMRFIGEADERLTAAIEDALAPPIDLAPFIIEVGELGRFPPGGPPRVMWLGVEGAVTALRQLAGVVSERLAMAGVPRDAQPFHPHLTLGRVREAAGLRTRELFEGMSTAHSGSWTVDTVTLYASRLLPQGPEHIARLHTALVGAVRRP